MHQLLLPKVVKVTLGGIFVQDFVTPQVTMGQFGQIFGSPSKTTKLMQMSIGLPERASKKNAATERTTFLRER